MTTGAEVSVFIKPVMWLVGGLVTLVGALVGYIWKHQDKKVKAVKDDHDTLQKDYSELALRLVTDYMTRDQTITMIESYNAPLIKALNENTEAQKELVQEIRTLRDNQLKAGIYD